MESKYSSKYDEGNPTSDNSNNLNNNENSDNNNNNNESSKTTEDELANSAPSTIFVGKDVSRLPNTSCFVTPGWNGQTQVMQMDIAGFSISAGSACSSGKITKGDSLHAMGFSSDLAECSVRISLGSKTTKDEIRRFVKEWSRAYAERMKRVA